VFPLHRSRCLTVVERGAARIGGIGLSLGGEILLEAAACDERIRAVVADGPGARSIKEEMLPDAPTLNLGLPFIWANNQAIAILSGDGTPERLDHLVARITPRPSC
jgi:pimeloyl-ACP methyl ester carboxylesterase